VAVLENPVAGRRAHTGSAEAPVPAPPGSMRCPRCHSLHPVLANEWFAEQSYLCPTCEHNWDTPARTMQVECPDRRMRARPRDPLQLTFGF